MWGCAEHIHPQDVGVFHNFRSATFIFESKSLAESYPNLSTNFPRFGHRQQAVDKSSEKVEYPFIHRPYFIIIFFS